MHSGCGITEMSDTLFSLVSLLADGRFHSGEALGEQLGIGRSAVWKSLKQLSELGLELHAVNGRGYRLEAPIELLNEKAITSLLDANTRHALSALQLFNTIESTSKYLKQQAELGAAAGTVCLAEYQSAGRGRRGRHWHSPYGSNLYFSVLWRFNDGMTGLGGLSLAIAVAMMRSFNELGAKGAGIKWPNDIVTEQGKMAGILLDVAGESSGPCHAVMGIGVNYAMSSTIGSTIEQAWINLCDCGVSAGRNEVIACLLRHIFNVVMLYEQKGFEPFREEWLAHDVLRDRAVTVHMADKTCSGIARGIDQSGLLLVEQQGSIRHYAAGEVSLRKAVA